ncbi:MAG TPA: ACT domain-containing protein [Actinomycetota bacterium]|nr:ACT domain-containing protein [Actinomycetota bacterium]
MLFTLRISLPDRPGTLGSVATAFGQGGANILALDVVDSEGGLAVDDMIVEAPEGMQMALLLAKQVVPGLVVEDLRPLEAFRDHMVPLEVAAALAGAKGDQPALEVLVERLPEALRSDWCVVLSPLDDRVRVLASSFGAPSMEDVRPTWLPLAGSTRLPPASWMPASWTAGPAAREGLGKFELAAAPVFDGYTAALVGRRSGPQYRNSELRELELLSRIAGSSEVGSAVERAF